MKAIFIAGLPGSGKSCYIKDIASNGEAKVFDDFKANAIDDNNRFPFSRRYVELINTLNSGNDCIISDIDFCRSEARQEAVLCVEGLVQGVEIEWWFFENNPAQCHNNVVQRATSTNRNVAVEKKNIDEYSKIYEISDDAEIIPVFDSGDDAIATCTSPA